MRFIKRNIPIFLTGLILLVLFAIIIAVSQTKPVEIPTLKTIDEADLIAGHTYILGFPEAPLSLVIFANYQNSPELPYLDAAYEVYKKEPRYLSLALRPFTQTTEGKLIAKAAQIAGDQGKYWEYAVLALEKGAINNENKEKITEKILLDWASLLNLNKSKFESGLKDKGYDSLIEADLKDAGKLEIVTSPTFFLNKQRLSAKNAEELKQLLEEEIARIKREKKIDLPGEETLVEPEEKELTPMQKERIETLMEIKYTEEGWDPKEVQSFKGQTIRWTNTTNKTIYLQPLDKSYEGLKSIVTIEPGQYFEYKFPSGGIFRYQEMATYHWGMVIIEW